MLGASCIRTRLSLSTEYEIYMDELIGYVTDHSWLSDSVLRYGLAVMTRGIENAVTISSFAFPQTHFPKQELFALRHVILLVNQGNCHWTVIIVRVEQHRQLSVYFYDPLNSDGNKEQLKQLWKDAFLPFLQRWHTEVKADTVAVIPFPDKVHVYSISTPTQPDGSGCGVMVLGMVHSFLTGQRGFELDVDTRQVIKVMRLRLQCVIMHRSTVHTISADDKQAASETERELVKFFKEN
ncbi:hypothetical protein PHYPSEUDO_014786 [Phytophthora pseudosyringae]|uniref:Ubiquitin-like protease family profile domain-containing protein n=1 Tax=Phytophthora pseudosyringae TaxID=221518 RepID=A0A8T1V3W0_9STRA|nr:hypothetical protein PHYPSEUDO_014786 [Phytophthora pseudosyringae]